MKYIIQNISIEAQSKQEAERKVTALESIAETFTVTELKTIARAVKIGMVKDQIIEKLNSLPF